MTSPGTHKQLSVIDTIATLLVIAASLLVLAAAGRRVFVEQPAVAPPQQRDESLSYQRSRAPHPLKGAPSLGHAHANVAIIEYADFECIYCSQFVHNTWPSLKSEYIDRGHVLFSFRHFPLESHRHARTAAVSASCAGEQDRFWEMHDGFFDVEKTLSDSSGKVLAKRLGLDADKFEKCAPQAFRDIDRDIELAKSYGIGGTPSFVIGRISSDRTVNVAHVLVGAQPMDRFKAILDELLVETQ